MILITAFGILLVLPRTETTKSSQVDITESDIIYLNSTTTNLPNEGVILIQSSETLYVVCRDGYGESGNRWGKTEAMVTCIDIGFIGGWTIDVEKPASTFTNHFVTNFDCSWPETQLCKCLNPDEVMECPNSPYPAGVHCYNNFSVHLIGGAAPNAGRVEVQYDDMWASVCYESSLTKRWSFINAQVVCKELGFPGTMFAGQGGLGQGTQRVTFYDYNCERDYSSLHECSPKPPIILPPEYQEPSCGIGRNEAVVVCSVPGYIGCFKPKSDIKLKQTSHELYLDNHNMTMMTIQKCRNHCRNLHKQLACLYKGGECFCRDTVEDYEHYGDEHCNVKCTGQELETCGGSGTISVYNVTAGICDDPLNGHDIYYYGDIFEDFTCAPGHQLIGSKSIQCVMEESGGMEWSHDFPECKDQDDNGSTYILVIAICVLAGSLVLLIPILILIVYRRKQSEQNNDDPPPIYDVIDYESCSPQPTALESECRVAGSTRAERAACTTNREVCQVCRNSYTNFKMADSAACSSADNCGMKGNEGWVNCDPKEDEDWHQCDPKENDDCENGTMDQNEGWIKNNAYESIGTVLQD